MYYYKTWLHNNWFVFRKGADTETFRVKQNQNVHNRRKSKIFWYQVYEVKLTEWSEKKIKVFWFILIFSALLIKKIIVGQMFTNEMWKLHQLWFLQPLKLEIIVFTYWQTHYNSLSLVVFFSLVFNSDISRFPNLERQKN